MNCDRKGTQLKVQARMARHFELMNYFIKYVGLDREDASRTALRVMDGKACPECGADFGKRHHSQCGQPEGR
jgi:hypothetical protein